MKTITLTEEEQRLICGCLAMGATISAMGPAKSEGLERYRQLMNLKEKIESSESNQSSRSVTVKGIGPNDMISAKRIIDEINRIVGNESGGPPRRK